MLVAEEEIDDGHCPGGTSLTTKLVTYQNKQSVNFLSIYDNLLTELWRDRAYTYAVNRVLPWGKQKLPLSHSLIDC